DARQVGIGQAAAIEDLRGHGRCTDDQERALCLLARFSPTPRTGGVDMDLNDEHAAAAFRRLLAHLTQRPDVQNIDLMILVGFCRNCLADWYREAAEAAGESLDREQARELV